MCVYICALLFTAAAFTLTFMNENSNINITEVAFCTCYSLSPFLLLLSTQLL